MKRFVLIVIILTMFVTGCSTTFSLEEKYYSESNLVEIDPSKLKTLLEDKESFGIFIYDSSCITSSDFNKVLLEFSNKYKIYLYKISFQNMKETSLSEKVKFCPSFAIYKNGKLVDYLDASSDEDTDNYKSVDNFSNWFFGYVNKEF